MFVIRGWVKKGVYADFVGTHGPYVPTFGIFYTLACKPGISKEKRVCASRV